MNNTIPDLNLRPSYLSQEAFAQMRDQYVTHVRQLLEDGCGPGSFQQFVELVNYVEHLKSMPIEFRVSQVVKPDSPLPEQRVVLTHLMRNKPVPTLVIEVSSDLHQIQAEVGDYALRLTRGASVDEAVAMRTMTEWCTGIGTFEDARRGYQTAYRLYGELFMEIATDSGSRLTLILDQLATKHLGMATHLLLLRMSQLIEEEDATVQFPLPDAALIAQHLGRFPRVVEQTRSEIDLDLTRRVIETKMSGQFVQPHAVVTFYANTALYALLMDDEISARRAERIAAAFIQEPFPASFLRLRTILQTWNTRRVN